MTRAEKIKQSSHDRARYWRDPDKHRARSRNRKQRMLIQRAIEAARIEIAAMMAS